MKFRSYCVRHAFMHLDIEAAFRHLQYSVGDGTRKYCPRLCIADMLDEENEEGQAFTYSPDPEGTILVEVFKCPDPVLALAHELVHVAQLIYGKPLCESEAYRLEKTIKHILEGLE